MSSASFGTVNATGLNVTGVLQASEIRTTRPMQVSNLTATGPATVGTLYVTEKSIEDKNLMWRMQLDAPEMAYNASFYMYNNFSITPSIVNLTVPIRKSDGSPSDYLTTHTDFANPQETNWYGNTAPLVKINGVGAPGGEYEYGVTWSNLLPPSDTVTHTFVGRDYQSDGKFTRCLSSHENWLAQQIKFGYPMPGKGGVKDYSTKHVFYNDLLSASTFDPLVPVSQYDAEARVNMTLAFDITRLIAGEGDIDLYISGGHNHRFTLELPDSGHDFSNAYRSECLNNIRLPVTTDPKVYDDAVAAGTTSVYLNTDLNIINLNIRSFPAEANVVIASGLAYTDSYATCKPLTFNGSFGFYKNYYPAPPTNNPNWPNAIAWEMNYTPGPNFVDDTLPDVVKPVNSGDIYIARQVADKPIRASLATADCMLQISPTVTFTFNFTDPSGAAFDKFPQYGWLNDGLNTVVTRVFREDTSGDNTQQLNSEINTVYAGFALPQYYYGVESNYVYGLTKQMTPRACEDQGWLFTNGTDVGVNENVPYLPNMTRGKSALATGIRYPYTQIHSNVSSPSTIVSPDLVQTIPSNACYSTYFSDFVMSLHEYLHGVQQSLGMISASGGAYGFDAEWFTQATTRYTDNMSSERMNENDCTYTNKVFNRGWTLPYMKHGMSDVLSPVTYPSLRGLEGVNFTILFRGPPVIKGQRIGAFTGTSYYIYEFISFMISRKHDPNMQHLKLFMYEMAKKVNAISNEVNDELTGNQFVTHNPSIVTHAMSNAVVATHMLNASNVLITNMGDFQEETTVAYQLARNNAAIPDKYKCVKPFWYGSSRSSNTGAMFSGGEYSATLKMYGWDRAQTNDDFPPDLQFWDPSYNPVQYHPDTLWWPRNITGNVNAYGDAGYYDWRPVDTSNVLGHVIATGEPIYDGGNYTPYSIDTSVIELVAGVSGNVAGGTYHAYTHDYTYKAICLTGNTFTTSITRYLYSLQMLSYALPTDMSSITVTLAPNGLSGLTGSYNTNVSVLVFKYIPDVCYTGVVASSGTFLAKGPYNLSGNGDDVTIDLTDSFANGGSFVSTGTYAGLRSFSNVTPYGVDYNDATASSWYTPSAHALTRATALGMVGGAYQPVTYIMITNKQIDPDDYSNSNKVYMSQVNPSCVTITAA